MLLKARLHSWESARRSSRAGSELSVSPNDRLIWIDGDLVPWPEATVHVLSHSMQRGTLVFDFMSVHETPRGVAVFRLGDHLQRLVGSCELVGLPLSRSVEELAAAICLTVRSNPGCHSVKISAYIPSIEIELVPQDEHVAVAIAAYDALEDIIKANPGRFHARDEIRLWVEEETRNRRQDILSPQAKAAGNYAPALLAKWRARRAGHDEILLCAEDGSLAETPTTNLFLVDASGVLRTPPLDHILHGVTRSTLLEIARAEGIDCAEAALFPDDLLAASEVFLSATTVGVWPVVAVNGKPVGDGSPGPMSQRLLELWKQVVAGEDVRFQHWLDLVGSE